MVTRENIRVHFILGHLHSLLGLIARCINAPPIAVVGILWEKYESDVFLAFCGSFSLAYEDTHSTNCTLDLTT